MEEVRVHKLCSVCNLGIGRFKDDVDLINKAISYLKDRGV